MPQQKDIVKIAIQMPGAYPQLIQLDQVGDTNSLPSLRHQAAWEVQLLSRVFFSGSTSSFAVSLAAPA